MCHPLSDPINASGKGTCHSLLKKLCKYMELYTSFLIVLIFSEIFFCSGDFEKVACTEGSPVTFLEVLVDFMLVTEALLVCYTIVVSHPREQEDFD